LVTVSKIGQRAAQLLGYRCGKPLQRGTAQVFADLRQPDQQFVAHAAAVGEQLHACSAVTPGHPFAASAVA
jgi:hypothetical protein